MSPDSFIPQAKACGQYLNSILAKVETAKAGYEEAILLDEHGNVCEGSGENIFLVRDGEISTPPPTASILDGITRRSVIQIAADLGFQVVERDIARGELYQADELFLTGTATEVAPFARSTTTCRAARRDHAGDPVPLLRGDPGQAAGVPRVARLRRARARRGRPGRASRRRELPARRAASRRCARAPRPVRPVQHSNKEQQMNRTDPSLRHDPPRRHAGRGHLALRRGEAERLPRRLDRLGIHYIEAGFPSSNPKEVELFELLAAERFENARSARSG